MSKNKVKKKNTPNKEDAPKGVDKKKLILQILIVGLAFITAFSFLFVSFIYM